MNDALIRELEMQRNFFATRCTQMAVEIADLQDAIAAKARRIADMEKALAPQEPDPQP